MKYQKSILFFSALVITTLVLYQSFSLPEVKFQDSSPGKFSAANAHRHLELIAQGPRRMYQPHYERVKRYVIDTLTQLGIPVEVQQSTAIEPRTPIFYSSVDNIIATIKGASDRGDAILLVAHLDSEPHIGPGALDNGAGVASFIEIARSLKRSEPLQDDVILLFSVPEECGMQGVVAFVKEHPLAKKVKLVFNCDGTGAGRYVVTNISPENHWLVAEMAKAYPRASAYSYISSADPFASREDLVFRLSGYPTIDLASAHYHERLWHSKHDDLNLITLSGLQENGDHLLALIKHFGDLDLNTKSSYETVFFSILHLFIIHYPKYWLIPLMILTVCLSAIILSVAKKRGRITGKGVATTFLTAVAGVLIASGLVKLVWFLVTELHPLYQFLFNNSSYNKEYFYLGFVGLSVISILVIFQSASRRFKITIDDVHVGMMVFLNACAVGSSAKSPHFASVLLWIVIAMQLLLVARLMVKNSPGFLFSVEVVYVALAVILLMPGLVALYMTDDVEPFRYAPTILLTLALLPSFYDSLTTFKKTITTILGISTLVLLIIPLSDTFRVGHPRVTYVACIADGDRGQSLWHIRNLYKSDLDEYSKQFVSDGQRQVPIRTFIPDYPYDFNGFFTRTDSVLTAAPILTTIRDSVSGEYRYLDVRIRSLRDAWEIAVFKNPELEVHEYALDGKKYEDQFTIRYAKTDQRVLCVYRNPRREGIVLSLKVKAAESVVLKVRDRTYGIPMKPDMKPMPDDMIPWIDYGANTTTVMKTYTL